MECPGASGQSCSPATNNMDVLKVINCYAQPGNTSVAGEMPIFTKRGLKRHNGSFDPQSLVLIEKAFDEAWLTLKSVGNKTVKPDELARSVLHPGDGRRARSRPIARRSAGATAARDQLARSELIA